MKNHYANVMKSVKMTLNKRQRKHRETKKIVFQKNRQKIQT